MAPASISLEKDSYYLEAKTLLSNVKKNTYLTLYNKGSNKLHASLLLLLLIATDYTAEWLF